MASEKFIKNSDNWEELGGGVSRQFQGWDNQIMMVKVSSLRLLFIEFNDIGFYCLCC